MSLTPKEIIDKMMADDAMSQWMGIEILNYDPGAIKLKMTVRKDMVNGFGVVHGGITYSLSDSALAFSCNSHGIRAMSIETSISHMKPVRIGDELTVFTEELVLTKKTGVYAMNVYNQDDVRVAHFKGTVYRSGIEWE